MEVILLERISRLGQMGETVKVKDGFARNFLLPQGKALRANEANKKKFEGQRVQLEARNLERKSEAQQIAEKLEAGAAYRDVPREQIPAGWAMFDICPESVALFASHIQGARTVIWNGPMGVFETPPFDAGTMGVAHALAAATDAGAITVVGGGDSAAAIAVAGLERRVTHVSTGGGASLEFLEGKTLPGVAALDDA